MPADATLADLDRFLRDIWLECCGHMSQFTIGKARYISHPDRAAGDRENRAHRRAPAFPLLRHRLHLARRNRPRKNESRVN